MASEVGALHAAEQSFVAAHRDFMSKRNEVVAGKTIYAASDIEAINQLNSALDQSLATTVTTFLQALRPETAHLLSVDANARSVNTSSSLNR